MFKQRLFRCISLDVFFIKEEEEEKKEKEKDDIIDNNILLIPFVVMINMLMNQSLILLHISITN